MGKPSLYKRFVDLISGQTVGGPKTFSEIPTVSRPAGSEAMLTATATGGDGGDVSVAFGVGSGGTNRGVFDRVQNRWLIYYDGDNKARINHGATVGSASEPVWLDGGEPTACGSLSDAYVTVGTAQTVSGQKTFTNQPILVREAGNSCMFLARATGGSAGTVTVGMGVGEGGVNRGVYDDVTGRWIIFFNEDGECKLDNGRTVGGSGTPVYLASGKPTACAGGTVPPGSVILYAGASTPSGWLICNGANVSRTTYADLYSAIGTSWGSGDGSSTFTLPDFRNRLPEGVGNTAVGGSIGAGVPNLTGYTQRDFVGWVSDETVGETYSHGCITISFDGTVSLGWGDSSAGSWNIRNDMSNGNSIYGSSSTVQPPALAVYFLVKT